MSANQSLLLVVFTLIASVGRPPVSAADQRPVLAFYYPWYESSDWDPGRMADLPAIPYQGGDEDTLHRHLQQAADNGIDGFICAWFGPNEPRLTERCDKLLMAAAGRNVAVTISPDQAADFTGTLKTPDGMAAALGMLRDRWMTHPHWLRWGGKPVVVFWNPTSFGDVAAWQRLRAAVDPHYAWHWMGEGTDFSYLDVFDSLYYYDITWAADPAAALAGYAHRLNNYNGSHGTSKPMIATVMPGYDDSRIRRGHVLRDRGNGAYYQHAWQAAIAWHAQAVIITSFNEWFEGTQIEPSQGYGALYLDLTRAQSRAFQAPGDRR